MTIYHADVLVYGATPCGVMAACTAASTGVKVILIEPTDDVFGVPASGLLNWDYGTKNNLYEGTWIPNNFFYWLRRFYGSNNLAYRGLARHYTQMAWHILKEYGVFTLTNHTIVSTAKTGTDVTTVTINDGTTNHTVVAKGASMNTL